MSDGKFFTQETKDLLKKAGDDALKLPFWAEPFDGPAFGIIINIVDKNADKVVPDEYDAGINSAIQNAFAGNFEVAEAEAATILNKVIDLPYLEEDTEYMVFVNGLGFLVSIIKQWIEKKKAA